MGTPVGELPGLGNSLVLSFVSLGLVCLLSYLVLRWLSRRGVGRGPGSIRVLARCPLEPRRSVYLLEAAGRCFLVGVGEGPMSLLAEVDPALAHGGAGEATAPEAGGGFAGVLARVLGKARP
jgi:flagellar protein FliO/FliZ